MDRAALRWWAARERSHLADDPSEILHLCEEADREFEAARAALVSRLLSSTPSPSPEAL